MSRSRLRIPEPYRKFARTARRAGWKIRAAGNGHLRWDRPGERPLFTASSPSASGAREDIAKLKRAGLTEEDAA